MQSRIQKRNREWDRVQWAPLGFSPIHSFSGVELGPWAISGYLLSLYYTIPMTLTSSNKGDLLAWCSVVCVSLYLHLGL